MSGEIRTIETFKYGKFVAKIKAPNKLGTCTSFFTYWNGPKWYAERWNEIDFEIVPSITPDLTKGPVSSNIIFGDGEYREERHVYLPEFNPVDQWHVYEMQWHPDYVRWLIDGKEIRNTTKWDRAIKYLDKPQVLMMNLWTPDFPDWSAGLTDTDMPYEAQFDYIETYSYNHKTKSFDLHWRDDFDYFDEGKWLKSNNMAFNAQGTTFFDQQVSVEDGILKLKMEKPKIKEEVVKYYELPGGYRGERVRGERVRHPALYDNDTEDIHHDAHTEHHAEPVHHEETVHHGHHEEPVHHGHHEEPAHHGHHEEPVHYEHHVHHAEPAYTLGGHHSFDEQYYGHDDHGYGYDDHEYDYGHWDEHDFGHDH